MQNLKSEEYKKLVELSLMLRLAESVAAELRDKLAKANEILRELILRKGNPDEPN